MENPDFIIVGAGSAGATLAARLSQDAATRVLLIEAGADTPPDATPGDIADTFPSASLNRSYFWNLECVRASGEAPRAFPQARIMGGGSSVMGLWALRGLPSDFDSWGAAGATGWGWSDVLPFYRRLENDLDRDDTRSEAGICPVSRIPPGEWPPFVTAMERAALARGLPHVADINEKPGSGFFAMPLSQDTARASTARCYLTAAVRRRANLAIMTKTLVTGLRFEGKRAAGVTVRQNGQDKRLSARQVVLSAGAIHSPVMLLRAGIGAAGKTRGHGIAPIADRPGVGRNLQNHLYLHFGLTLPRGQRLQAHLRRFCLAGIRLSSGMENCPANDLLLFMIARVSPRSYGPDLGMVGAALYSPFSRGEVSLTGAGFTAPPRIDFRMLEDPRDAPRLLQAARFAEAMLLDSAVAATYSEAFLLPSVMALNQFNRPGWRGRLLGIAAKAALNAPAPLRRVLVGGAIRPGRWFAGRQGRVSLADEELLAAAAPMAHAAGTCAIGREDDPAAVVDSQCRVHGVGNLRVVDASIMPVLPAANTNLPTVMVAERAADLIRKGS